MRWLLEQRETPIGAILLITDEDGCLRGLDFADHEARLRHLLTAQNQPHEIAAGAAPRSTAAAIDAYFAGDLNGIDRIPIATGGTAFQCGVWAALRAIPAGATTSYGVLAAQLGRPKASRAVGAANGSNPISIVVPCHRVIGANGALTGYGGGLPRKKWLLAHEQSRAV